MLASTDRQGGRPVVLLHGQPGGGASWSPLIARLDSEFRVLAPDRPGYGATVGPARGLAANADWVATFLREQGAAPATVVGHSWAGGVALLLAHRHPDTVRTLVLVGSVGTADSVNTLDRVLATRGVGGALTMVGLTGISLVFPQVRRLVMRTPAGTPKRDHLAATLPDASLFGGWGGAQGREWRTFMTEQRALLDELPEISALLGSIAVPVTVVVGEWDVVVPPKAASSLARAIPDATLVRLPRAGHFVARDAPDALAGIVRSSDRQAGG